MLCDEKQGRANFRPNMPCCLPVSDTCINRLTIAIEEHVHESKEEMHHFFYYAFANDYFGMA